MSDKQAGQAQPPQVLWTDNEIARYAKANMAAWEDNFAAGYWMGKWVRDKYEAERATLAARVDALQRELDNMREMYHQQVSRANQAEARLAAPSVPILAEVRDVIQTLLENERLAVREYHYDVYGHESLSETLQRLDRALAWLATTTTKEVSNDTR